MIWRCEPDELPATRSGVIQAVGEGTTPAVSGILLIVLKALGFLVGAILVGSFLSPRVFRYALALRSTGVVQALALGLCFGLAWLAGQARLAPITTMATPPLLLWSLKRDGAAAP
jgi:Kef-type K+ transport system membrane component KefB